MDYNILIADFAGKNRICMTDTLYQYDYGQKLKIESIPALPQTFEAHFSNVQHGGVSITVTGMDGIVDIPNTLLMTGKRIYCWIYVTEPGSGETVYQILLPVQHRPMPEYYDVTDVGVFDSVVQQVGDYAATATAGATNATASATAAATSASEAAASASAAESAKTAAETAQGKAEDAQAAAETAAQTATEKAQQTAQDAAQAASDAGRAESAAQSAEAAQTGAESAKTDAETAAQGAAASASAASASATSAGQSATAAAGSANAAAGSATTAENAAQTATTKAGEASASATAANTAKTAAQTAQTAAEAAETNAGQSASTATAKAAEAAQSAANAAQSKTDAEAAATRAEQAAASLTVDDALSDVSENPVQNKVITESVTQVKSAIDALKITDTASGAIASFSDGSANPIQSLSVSLSPIQEGSGDPSPDNVRPISGRDSVTVMRAGKNLFNKTTVTPTRFVSADGTLAYSANNAASDYIPVKAGVSMIVSGLTASSAAIKTAFYDREKVFISAVSQNKPTYSFTTPSGAEYARITVPNADIDTAQLEIGSTASDYAPYDGASVTVQLGQTVYGGTTEIISGSGESTMAMVDLGTLTWSASSISGVFRTPISALNMAQPTIGATSTAKCEAYKAAPTPTSITADAISDGQFIIGRLGVNNLYICNTAYTDAAAFKASLSGIHLCYPLAEPFDIDITPAQLSTLRGDNTVWSDGDSVEVEYVCDPKLYIDKKITAAVAALA